MTRPEIGLMLLNRGPVIGAATAPELIDLAVAAEEQDWDSVWVGDSFLAKPRLDSIVTLSAVAARTSRVRLGPACMASTPLRPALLLAYQWASLDHLSGGRTIFVACQGGGPGSGEFAQEMAAVGIERASRMGRMEEAIEVMRLLWSGERADYHGQYVDFTGLSLQPRPKQERIPIWIATNPDLRKPRNVESAYRRLVRLGDGWQTTHTTPEHIARSLDIIHRYAEEDGRELGPDFEVSVCSNICIADSKDEALSETKAFLDAHSIADYHPDFLEKWAAMGTPEMCIKYLRRFIDAGATSILLRISSFDQTGQFERVTNEVLPALRAATVGR